MTGRIVVKNPMPWSVDTPYLYQMRSRLYEGEELLDENVETFGIRTLALDARSRSARKWKKCEI